MTKQEIDNLKHGDMLKLAHQSEIEPDWYTCVYMQFDAILRIDGVHIYRFIVLHDASSPKVTNIYAYHAGYKLQVSEQDLRSSTYAVITSQT